MSQGCLKVVPRVFERCSKGVRGHFMIVLNIFFVCFKGASRVFQGCLKGVSKIFQTCSKEDSKKFQESFKGVSRKF